MSYDCYRAALAARALGATLAELAVAFSLACHADKQGQAFPGRTRIAHETHLAEVSVKQALRRLKELGVITIEKPGVGRGNKTIYRFVRRGPEKGGADIPLAMVKRVVATKMKGCWAQTQ